MRVWLDDCRNPAEYGFLDCTWVKFACEAVELLKTGQVDFISLDHDLAWEHQPASGVSLGDYKEQTGYSVVCWMEENNVFPLEVQIHSANPVGKERMLLALSKYFKYQDLRILGWGHEAILLHN